MYVQNLLNIQPLISSEILHFEPMFIYYLYIQFLVYKISRNIKVKIIYGGKDWKVNIQTLPFTDQNSETKCCKTFKYAHEKQTRDETKDSAGKKKKIIMIWHEILLIVTLELFYSIWALNLISSVELQRVSVLIWTEWSEKVVFFFFFGGGLFFVQISYMSCLDNWNVQRKHKSVRFNCSEKLWTVAKPEIVQKSEEARVFQWLKLIKIEDNAIQKL